MKKITLVFVLFSLLSAGSGTIFAQSLQEITAEEMYDMGMKYYNGDSISQDYAEALKWYQRAAEQGDASAMLNIGVMYDKGQGVPQNYAEALKWLRRAAQNGSDTAKETLTEIGETW